MIHRLILPNGETLSSGGAGVAIMAVELTQEVNTGQELTLGSVCAAMAEITLFAPDGISLNAGDRVILQADTEQVGVFYVEAPQKLTANTYRITAYDGVSRLDKDVGDYIENLTGWPYTLMALAQAVCGMCGVTLATRDIPNGDYPVAKFSAGGITGRQVMAWVGQASARFCRANPQGEIVLDWYTPATVELTPGGEHYYYQDSLSREDYTVSPVKKVHISLVDGDVGAVYPDTPEEGNTYRIGGNYLLTNHSTGALQAVAQGIFQVLEGFSYVPCTVRLPARTPVSAGQILTVQDPKGIRWQTLVMKKVITPRGGVLESVGSASRESTTAFNQTSFGALSGKVLILQKGVEGLRAESREASGKTASLTLSVEGLVGQVSRQEQALDGVNQQITTLNQTAQSITLAVEQIAGEGVTQVKTKTGYTFGEKGLHIAKEGQEMENTLDHRGMVVSRSGEVILQADAKGVVATDVTARNYLSIGHSRFEEYSDGNDQNRTACFFIQEVL